MLLVTVLISALVHLCVGGYLNSPLVAHAHHVSPDVRIINGKDAEPHVAPYMAFIVLLKDDPDNQDHYCGGTLIHEEFVLTAAHCLTKPGFEIERVALGLYNFNQTEPLQEIWSSAFAVHESYTASPSALHDIAIIKLRRAANVTAGLVETVELASAAAFPDKQDAYDGDKVTLYGWGRTQEASSKIPSVMQVLDAKVLPHAQCDELAKDASCVAREDGKSGGPCQGDSGSPLMTNGVQIGVLGERTEKSCASNKATFFARVDYHIDWIKKKMAEL